MKTSQFTACLSALALALWVAGCKPESQNAGDPAKAAGTASETVAKTVEAAKDAGAKLAQEAADKTKEIAAPLNAKAQELIVSAQKLVGDGKFQDALAKLKEISGEKLSASQQTVVDTLKAQIEKALGATSNVTSNATSAINGLLPKN